MNAINVMDLWEDIKCPANRQWPEAVVWQGGVGQRREWLSEDVRIVGEVDFEASAMGALGNHEETEQPLDAAHFRLAIRRPTANPLWAMLWDVAKARLQEAIANHTQRAMLCPMFQVSGDQLHLHHPIFQRHISRGQWTIPPHRRTEVAQLLLGYKMVPVPVRIQDDLTGEYLHVPVDMYGIALENALVDVKFRVLHVRSVDGEEGAEFIHAVMKDVNILR